MWSKATEALGRRYHAMYGFMQGVWVSMLVLWMVRQVTPGWESWVLFVLGVASSQYWRHCWRKYRDAFRAETDASIAEAKADIERFTAELEALGVERQ